MCKSSTDTSVMNCKCDEKYSDLEDDYDLQCQCRDAYRYERDVLQKQINELKRYFTSANSIPVERATILAKDFWEIVK